MAYGNEQEPDDDNATYQKAQTEAVLVKNADGIKRSCIE